MFDPDKGRGVRISYFHRLTPMAIIEFDPYQGRLKGNS